METFANLEARNLFIVQNFIINLST